MPSQSGSTPGCELNRHVDLGIWVISTKRTQKRMTDSTLSTWIAVILIIFKAPEAALSAIQEVAICHLSLPRSPPLEMSEDDEIFLKLTTINYVRSSLQSVDWVPTLLTFEATGSDIILLICSCSGNCSGSDNVRYTPPMRRP